MRPRGHQRGVLEGLRNQAVTVTSQASHGFAVQESEISLRRSLEAGGLRQGPIVPERRTPAQLPLEPTVAQPCAASRRKAEASKPNLQRTCPPRSQTQKPRERVWVEGVEI